MGSHETPSENRHGYDLRVGEMDGCPPPKHQGPVGRVAGRLQRSPHRRLPPQFRGGILQAPWPNRVAGGVLTPSHHNTPHAGPHGAFGSHLSMRQSAKSLPLVPYRSAATRTSASVSNVNAPMASATRHVQGQTRFMSRRPCKAYGLRGNAELRPINGCSARRRGAGVTDSSRGVTRHRAQEAAFRRSGLRPFGETPVSQD
jgi:hypothetical protein